MKLARSIALILPLLLAGCDSSKVFYACASAQSFVEHHILNPRTAVFSSCHADNIVENSDGTTTVSGDVAYDSGFGFTMHPKFIVVQRHDQALNADRLVALSFDGKPYDLNAE